MVTLPALEELPKKQESSAVIATAPAVSMVKQPSFTIFCEDDEMNGAVQTAASPPKSTAPSSFGLIGAAPKSSSFSIFCDPESPSASTTEGSENLPPPNAVFGQKPTSTFTVFCDDEEQANADLEAENTKVGAMKSQTTAAGDSKNAGDNVKSISSFTVFCDEPEVAAEEEQEEAAGSPLSTILEAVGWRRGCWGSKG